MKIQILSDGAVSANWAIAIVIAICGVLLTRVLNRLESRQDAHGKRLDDHAEKIVEHTVRLDNHDKQLDNVA